MSYIGVMSFMIFPEIINGEYSTSEGENKLANKYSWNALCKMDATSGNVTGKNCDISIQRQNSTFDVYAKLTNYSWIRKSLNDKVVFSIGQIMGGGYWSQSTIPILLTNIPTSITVSISL